jgi:hypothetical protein
MHGQHRARLNRRRLLQIGGLGSLGLTLPNLLRAEAAPGPTSRIRSCILIFFYGGPSHIDTFDMKPNAPAEVRGQFSSISTCVPGIRVCELLPQTAGVVDRLAIIRSMHHPMTNHNAAAFTTLCGRNPLKGDLELLGNDRSDPPCYGAAISASLPERPGLPPFVALPHVMYNVVQLPGQVAGFLGSAHDAFQVNADPSAADFQLGELDLPSEISLDRLDHRAVLLKTLDHRRRRAEAINDAASKVAASPRQVPIPTAQASGRSVPDPRDAYTEKAFRLLHSPAMRRAFHLAAECPRQRDRYGRTKLGQSALLARRLVEAGVRFVTVYDGQYNGQTANWDAHENVFGRLKNDLVPPADHAIAALIEDLTSRGLLDETLVIAMGEFGRTPKINGNAGRDHFPGAWSCVFAGGGIRGGQAHGKTTADGMSVASGKVDVGDVLATLAHSVGVPPTTENITSTGRPIKIAEGTPIHEILT